MKKKLLITGMILIVTAIICGFYAFNRIFPKANPIRHPDKQVIDSVSITHSDDEELIINEADFDELLLNFNSAVPTRKQSLNDSPAVESYYGIAIQTDEENYYYFVYEEDSNVYIEMPYEGIYRSSEQMINFVMKYCEE